MTVLLLLAIALPFSAGTAFASTNVTSSQNTSANNGLANVTDQNLITTNITETTNQSNTTENNTQIKNATTTITANSSSTNQAAGSASTSNVTKTTNSSSKELATGSPSSVSFSNAEITNAASLVLSFVQNNDRLPNYVTISNTQVTMPEFLQLMVTDLLDYNNKINTPITLTAVSSPTNPAEVLKIGNILKSEYISLATSIENTITSTGKAPDEISTSLGTINFDNLVYSFSEVLNFEGNNQRLPNFVSVEPWSDVLNYIPASLDEYLQPTANCQSNSPTIIALANKITAGCTTPYEKAVALFNWVTNNITYSFYYNTKYGALGTLAAGTGNCCDHSNLMVALARAAGIPARYQLGNCDFYGAGGGWYGHVWAQLYVNGKWYYADTISTLNTFGVINNWNLSTYTLEGTYASLPF